VTNLPDFDLGHRFSIPDDFALMKDSQTNVLFNYSFSPSWEFRDGFLGRRTSEEYFVTEGVYYDPDDNSVPREGLYFHHHRHPLVNQSDLVGHFNVLNMSHTLLTGVEYRRFHIRTDVTAGACLPITRIRSDWAAGRHSRGPSVTAVTAGSGA
jgi:outer membrane receptor protein involved in Fe transport